MGKTLLALIALFLSTISWSQSSYRFRNYSITEGLSQSSVTAIIQDDANTLWIGTQDGLNRFDGRNFEVFTSDNNKGIISGYIRCAQKSKDGSLWFGTLNGLTHYNPSTEFFETYTYQKSAAIQIDHLIFDEAGLLWVSSLTHGLLSFDPKQKQFKRYTGILPSSKVQSIFPLTATSLLVNTEDKGLYTVNLSTKKAKRISIPFPNQKEGSINRITQSESQRILLCTSLGVFEYNQLTKKVAPKFEELNNVFGKIAVTDIQLCSNDDWILSTNGLGLITVKNDERFFNTTQDIFQKNALLNNKVNQLYKDNDGVFWVGTDRGLSSFNPQNQGFLGIGPSGNLKKGLPSPSVWCFDENADESYLFVGTDAGVSRFNKKTLQFEHFLWSKEVSLLTDDQPNEKSVHALYVLNDNEVLVGSSEGLYRLTIHGQNDFSFKRIDLSKGASSILHNRIYSIIHFKGSQYFLGTKGGAILVDIKSGELQVFEHQTNNLKNTITSGYCRYIYKDLKNRFFFATSTGGLSILKESGNELKIVPYAYNSIITSKATDYITSIYQSSPNEFWIGTLGSGLIYWNEKTKKCQFFTKENGLPNNVVYAVLNDNNSKLWLSTNKGICCFDRKTFKTRNYLEINGLMSNEFNLGAFHKSKNGELYFGGIYGYNYFNPKHLNNDQKDVRVHFTKFKLDKDWLKPNQKGSPLTKPISKTDILELSYRQRTFALRFIPSDLSNPELINYKYFLEGSDEGDIFLGNHNELRFTSVSPGEYTLKVYARSGEGNWSTYPTSIQIIIASPFWAKWWFWIVSALVILILVRWFIRQKIELERRKLVRLEMKIAERTREIRDKNTQIEAQNEIIQNEKSKVEENQRLLQIEKDKSEKLLRKIIPESTVEELKNSGTTSARAYKKVSVLFTDFVGFTKIADSMNPSDLVGKLDVYFRKFDDIIVANNLEKIKTIGDAYMCAGGVPVRNNTNPIDTCLAALQIQAYMNDLKAKAIEAGEDYWQLRLGINTGEVTAGVIGSQRLAYDIWGATVNRAQRMEMLGQPGKVTITGDTYKLVQPYFECTFMEVVKSKNSNVPIEMYTVERIKPSLSLNGEGLYPNERFQQVVNLYLYSSINYNKAERHIYKLLKKELSPKLHYHCFAHTVDVVNAVENLALTENVTDEGLFLLKSAASYHDAGFIEQYDKNEPIGARMAEEILPRYGYTPQHIQQIKELIYVTEIPHKPKNNLEEIMCDADLDYLGRDDFHEIADRLRVELREHGKINSDRLWDQIQIDFLTKHRYFTQTAIRTRVPKKLQNIEEIKQRLLTKDYID
jgi:ligand-binding sensor domain-containing protein/class 3 adenylate cyclase/predicted metal-dependent HD superfamily phosphohydrolase